MPLATPTNPNTTTATSKVWLSMGDGHGLRQKLHEDVAALGAQGLFYPISRVRCATETSMMFTKPRPPMPRVNTPMQQR